MRNENIFPGPGMFNQVSTKHLKIDSSILESHFLYFQSTCYQEVNCFYNAFMTLSTAYWISNCLGLFLFGCPWFNNTI